MDDDPNVREALQWLVESVGLQADTFASAREFLGAYNPARPGCLVLDVRMPGMSGVEVQERLSAQKVTLPVIVITGYGDVPTVVRAMKLGAVDILEKPFSHQVLLDRIQECLETDERNRLDQTLRGDVLARFALLTQRQRDVMKFVAAGQSNKAVAVHLGIHVKTVEAHRAEVMKRMKANSLADLIQMAGKCDPY